MPTLKDLQTRPPTLALSTRVDMRYLAALYTFWAASLEGLAPRSISELSRLSLEGLAEMLISKNLTSLPPTQESARQILIEAGLLGPSKGGGILLKRNMSKATLEKIEFDIEKERVESNRKWESLRQGMGGIDLKEAERRLEAALHPPPSPLSSPKREPPSPPITLTDLLDLATPPSTLTPNEDS